MNRSSRHAAPVVWLAAGALGASLLAGCPSPGGLAAATPTPTPTPGTVPSAIVGAAPTPVPASPYEAPRLTVEQYMARLAAGEALVLVDVRARESYDLEHAQGAVAAPWADMAAAAPDLPKDKPLLLYCT